MMAFYLRRSMLKKDFVTTKPGMLILDRAHTQWKKVQAWVDILQISVSCRPKPWITAFVHRHVTKVYKLHNKNPQNSVNDFLFWSSKRTERRLRRVPSTAWWCQSTKFHHKASFMEKRLGHLHCLYQVILSTHFFSGIHC